MSSKYWEDVDGLLSFISGYVGDYLPDPHYTTLKKRVGGLIDLVGAQRQEIDQLQQKLLNLANGATIRIEMMDGSTEEGFVVFNKQVDAAFAEGEEVYSQHSSFYDALAMLGLYRANVGWTHG